MLRSLRITLASLAFLFLISSPLFAQSIQGSITGVVTDPQGSIVAGAKVVAVEVATNARREATTNSTGLYSFQDLPPGTYVVTVSASGFKEVKSSKMVLVAAASLRFDAALAVGAVSEVVEVKATQPTMNVETAETGSLLTGEDIIRAPMTRSAQQIVLMSSGAVMAGSHLLVGGQRSNYQNLTLDGVTNMNNIFGSSAGHLVDQQSFESLAEVKVTDGNGSAETSGFNSMVATTKSGTNQFHGSAFYTTDNSVFDSNGFDSTKGKGPKLQLYGVSLGGPVWWPHGHRGNAKTFFFVTWEHRTNPLGAAAYTFDANLPTAAFQGKTNANGNADFSSLLLGSSPIQLHDPFNGGAPFAGNIIPHARLSSVALALQNNYYPAIDNACPGASSGSYLNNYCAVAIDPEHVDRYDIRIDHLLNNRDTLSGRFTRDRDPEPNNYDTNTSLFKHSRVTSGINTYVAETHSFSSALMNEFRLGFSRDVRNYQSSHDGNTVLKQIGLNLGVPVPVGTTGFPNISFNDVEGFGDLGPGIQIGQEYSLLNNVTWQKGRHGIKAGVLLRYGRPQISDGNLANQFGSFSFDGSFSGFEYADFLLGVPFQASLNNNVSNEYFRKLDTGLFVQDSWHATSKLTLTLGLRWEHYMPPVDANDRRANFDPATGNMVVPSAKTLGFLNPALSTAIAKNIEVAPAGYPGRSLLDGRKTNFGPRFGFAYLISKSTVVRGGYGIYHGVLINTVQDNLSNTGLFGIQTGSIQNSFTGNVPLFQFPNPFPSLSGGSTCVVKCLTVSGTDPHLKTPTTQQWNFTIEHELGHSLVARASYRGFMTTQLPITNDLNIPRIVGGTPAYPLYNHVLWTSDGGIQKMNSLDLALERKFTGNLTFQAAYTLQKNLTDAQSRNGKNFTTGDGEGGSPSNPYDRAADMGNAYYTARHRMVNTLAWGLPFGRSHRFGSSMPKPMDYALGDWEVTAINVLQSGHFLTPALGITNGLIQNNSASLRPNCSGSLTVSNPSREEWFNTAAFTTPTPGTYGNCGTGVVQGPGLFAFNFGIHKYFHVGEKARLRFEANMVNAFNHGMLNDPALTSTSSGNFGVIPAGSKGFVANNSAFSSSTNANGERHIWVGLRFEF